MVYYGYFQKVQICFLEENVFMEKQQHIVKEARNCDEDRDGAVPAKIPLKNITMKKADYNKLMARFNAKVKKKKAAKSKKKALA